MFYLILKHKIIKHNVFVFLFYSSLSEQVSYIKEAAGAAGWSPCHQCEVVKMQQRG